MLGAIIGDIVGSRFEWDNIKVKQFQLLTKQCFFTDDSAMTIAIAEALLHADGQIERLAQETIRSMRRIGRKYPSLGYGESFFKWLYDESTNPYRSYGNGAAMRVSPVAYVARSLEEVIRLAEIVTAVTHNHPEGLKGGEATAVAIYLAWSGSTQAQIRDYIQQHYYNLNVSLDDIRSTYQFDVTCQGTVPQAIIAFLESTSFEDAIRNAISIGGDSDTVAAITGSIAEAFYGIPLALREHALTYLPVDLRNIVFEFENKSGRRHEIPRKN